MQQRFTMDARSHLAWELLRQPATLATCKTEGEDSAGRARLQPLTPQELVDRALAIADTFIATAKVKVEEIEEESDA